VAAVLTIGLLDQTRRGSVPDYERVKTEYLSDRRFFTQVEDSLPEGAMVFQLPYVPFPENPTMHRMLDYDHFRGFLHSRSLRWSYGAFKGREGDAWQRAVAALPPQQLVQKLCESRFAGIHVDRYAYPDNGAELEGHLSCILGPPRVVSPNQRFVFFNLNGSGGG
jgi:phosphoglycerol transferase